MRSRILTLVFTDLADSTALKLKHGEQAAAELLERHRTIVIDLCAQSGGHVIDWAGDGCFLIFEAARSDKERYAILGVPHIQRGR